jgi:hypothetical protein
MCVIDCFFLSPAHHRSATGDDRSSTAFFFHPLIIAQHLLTIAHRLLFLSPAHHRSATGDDRSSTAFFFHPLIIAQQLVTIAHRLLFPVNRIACI